MSAEKKSVLLLLRQKRLKATKDAERYLSMADLEKHYYYSGFEDGLNTAIEMIEKHEIINSQIIVNQTGNNATHIDNVGTLNLTL